MGILERLRAVFESAPDEELAALEEGESGYDCTAGRHEPVLIRSTAGVLGAYCKRCRAHCDENGEAVERGGLRESGDRL